MSVRLNAHAWSNPPRKAVRRSATVVGSVWSAVGFVGGWSSTRVKCLPATAFSRVSRTCWEVKSYRPTVSEVWVWSRKPFKIGHPLSGLAPSCIVAVTCTGARGTGAGV